MPTTVTLFPDTNIFLHYPPIKDIDWKAITGADEVKLVVCLPVIKELDNKKSGHSLQDRAKRAIKEIKSYRSGTEVVPGVTLQVFNQEIRAEEFPETLSMDSSDDQIVHLVLKYRAANAGTDVRVVTEDMGMELRCEAHSVLVCTPDSKTRLQDQADDLTRKNRQLQVEINELKNRLPRLRLWALPFGVEGGFSETCIIALTKTKSPVTPLYKSLEELRAAHGEKSPHRRNPMAQGTGLPHYPDSEFRRYNSGLPQFYTRYGTYLYTLDRWNTIHAYAALVTIYLENYGTQVATDIALDITFPELFAVVADAELKSIEELGNPDSQFELPMLFPQEPNPPNPPRLYTPETREYQQVEKRPQNPNPWQLSIPDTKRRETATLRVKLEAHYKKANLTAFVKRLRHSSQMPIAHLYLLFHFWEEASSFNSDFSMLAVETPKRETGKLHFVITKTEGSTE